MSGGNAAGLASPTLAGFVTFVQKAMQVPVTAIPNPATDPSVAVAYGVAVDLVNLAIAAASTDLYALAVYNLAASNLINYYVDAPGAPLIMGSEPPNPYFANLRAKWAINSFVAGVIQSSSDEGTSQSILTPDAMKMLSLAELQYLKDPFGRQYLAIAQRFGSLWGLT